MAKGQKVKGKKGQPKAANNDPQPSTNKGTTQQNGQEKLEIRTKWIKSHPTPANDYPQPSSSSGTGQKGTFFEKAIIEKAIIEKAIFEYEKAIAENVKERKGQPKNVDDPQPSTSSGTNQQNGQKASKKTIAEKAKQEKDNPKAANNDTKPSKSTGTTQQNGEKVEGKKGHIKKAVLELNDEANGEEMFETCEYCDLTQPKSSILIHIDQTKACKAHYGPRFKAMKALNDQEELEKLAELAKQNVQEEIYKRAELAKLVKLAHMKKKLCKLQAVLSNKTKQKAGLIKKSTTHDPLKSKANRARLKLMEEKLLKKQKEIQAERQTIKEEVSSIGCKTANASKNLNILNLESQISVSIAMDFTEAKPSEAQLEKLSKLQEKMTKRYLYILNLESQISMEKRPVDETAEWENGHPMADNKDQQPLTSNGTTQQNDQEKLDEKAKLATDKKDTSKKDNRKKGHPITENNDPQPSTSSGTIQQNETKSLPSESPQLPFISHSYYSSDSISLNHENTVVPKECIKHFTTESAGRSITLYPEPWGTNELEFCKPVNVDFTLTKEHKASGIKATAGYENWPSLGFGCVLPNLETQEFDREKTNIKKVK